MNKIRMKSEFGKDRKSIEGWERTLRNLSLAVIIAGVGLFGIYKGLKYDSKYRLRKNREEQLEKWVKEKWHWEGMDAMIVNYADEATKEIDDEKDRKKAQKILKDFYRDMILPEVYKAGFYNEE